MALAGLQITDLQNDLDTDFGNLPANGAALMALVIARGRKLSPPGDELARRLIDEAHASVPGQAIGASAGEIDRVKVFYVAHKVTIHNAIRGLFPPGLSLGAKIRILSRMFRPLSNLNLQVNNFQAIIDDIDAVADGRLS